MSIEGSTYEISPRAPKQRGKSNNFGRAKAASKPLTAVVIEGSTYELSSKPKKK